MKRAQMTTAQTIAPLATSPGIAPLPTRSMRVRACNPVMRNTMPSIR